MTLKARVSGVNERFISPPVIFVNGVKKKPKKGVCFINGQKVQLWGNTRCEFSSFTGILGSSGYLYPYIDESRMIVFGDTLIYIGYNNGMPVSRLYSNMLNVVDISDTSGTFVSQNDWGKNLILSPTESTANSYVYYTASGRTRNKIVMTRNGNASVAATYNPGIPTDSGHRANNKLEWCVPLSNGKNLWYSTGTYWSTPEYYLGYDSTVVTGVVAATVSNPYYGGGDFVVCHSGNSLTKVDITGTTTIVSDVGVTINTKMVDGNYVLVSGANKVIKYAIDGTEEWHIDFDSSRIIKIIGKGGDYYYLIDMPTNSGIDDQKIYIRKIFASNGVQSNVVSGTYNGIISWYTYPYETKNGMLVAGAGNYFLKIFTD